MGSSYVYVPLPVKLWNIYRVSEDADAVHRGLSALQQPTKVSSTINPRISDLTWIDGLVKGLTTLACGSTKYHTVYEGA